MRKIYALAMCARNGETTLMQASACIASNREEAEKMGMKICKMTFNRGFEDHDISICEVKEEAIEKIIDDRNPK
jgi:uncharacterized protein with GYD domain